MNYLTKKYVKLYAYVVFSIIKIIVIIVIKCLPLIEILVFLLSHVMSA